MAGTGNSGPLAGVRVVELAGLGPAPFCAMLLADLGADVVLVDRPGAGARVDRPDGSDQTDLLNRGKRSIAVDLKHERGAAAVLALAERADVLLEGLRPGVAERLGVGPRQCWEVNPRLVYGRMTGWGQDGPLAPTAGHDIGYIALTGMLHAIGRAGGPPQVPLNLLGDFGGGSMYLAVGVLAALLEARGSGRGQVVDASIVDGAAHLGTMIHGMRAAGGWSTTRGTNLLDTGAPFYDVYETADGEHMAVGALEPKFYAELVRRLGAEDLPDRDDPANWAELRRRFAEIFARRTRAEWTEVFEGSDACVAPVLSMAEAPRHPHVAARGTLVEREGVLQPAPAPRFSRTPNPAPRAVPAAGADAAAVLDQWQVAGAAELLDSGAIARKEA
ncbi:alpha-methylacyl-CoA racemase [Saccharopolyspora erythraea NRRL 2338]|uniref:Alpha-methylacyl-CoA racemase n=2 Tax=Saccharopolyspora erythraea TaxID=1836 RepID=A4FNB5_SACEN|nr:CaiB/BaiF CoA-transferase family protein [Saccharopolyspora erythraea]EQD87096.1 L-carnitine dehydratase [Saccharopolyspora erythraea D]PFG99179.1 alpha-methylacyl-CoA racemase [Saccharopolyspora erythraea NRRL 2338]QRK89128.1 CoA transferase [Saccharopolyspora erythraea]CAM05540.1 alpha-methylacyl-CoA racemase [Saccharopolyspora erythraea NRRL 2338]